MTLLDIREVVGRLARFRFIFVILVNLIPIGGVALLGWDGGQILFLYWLENVIIGLVTLPRIIAARGFVQDPTSRDRNPSLGVGCFFVLHYGVFCIVHGVFTLILATDFFLKNHPDPNAPVDPPFDSTFLWALAVLFGLHVIALVRDWWLPRAWRTAHPVAEMFRPYGRIFVLHITVLGGAWAMQKFGAPEWAILILCLTKAVLELATAWLSRTAITDTIKAAPLR